MSKEHSQIPAAVAAVMKGSLERQEDARCALSLIRVWRNQVVLT